MTTVTIVTATKDNRCMSHEQHWMQVGVYSDFKLAKDKAFNWLNAQSKARNSYDGSHPDADIQNAFIESECGHYAVVVQEHEVLTE